MYYLGFDIGGTKCAVILGNDTKSTEVGDIIADKLSFPTVAERGWRAVVSDLLAGGDALLKKNGLTKADVKAAGISCGGPLDSKRGLILSPPNLPDWDGVPITELVSAHFGCPAVVQNDANACAVAEWKFGAGKGLQNLIFLTCGTGMGAGLIIDGRLYSGANDMAGEVGHMRLAEDGPMGYGKVGSFEGFCSGGGIKRLAEMRMEEAKAAGRASSLFGLEKISAKTVAIEAKKGDALAKEVYEESARRLGQALALLIDILNPEAVIIGSIYTRDTALFEKTVQDVIRREALPYAANACRILPAKLTENIGDIAALGLVM